jgi:hypothetical protein
MMTRVSGTDSLLLASHHLLMLHPEHKRPLGSICVPGVSEGNPIS